jgi:hypothetical protein
MRVALLALLLLCLSLAATAATVVVNFDDLPNDPFGAAVPAGYGGLNWSTDFGVWTSCCGYPPHSGLNALLGNRVAPGVATMVMTFVTPAAQFQGAWFSGADTATFELYLGGILQGSSLTLSLTGNSTWLASGYAGAVDEVRLTANRGSFVMDDFHPR